MSEIRTRPALLYNLWTVLHCLDQPPVDGTSCLVDQGSPRALEPLIEELGYEYEYLIEDEGFGDLPEACRAALDESYARLNASYEAFLDISMRELVSSDIELLEMLGPATYPIEDVPQLSNPGPLYPLDETTVLVCVAA